MEFKTEVQIRKCEHCGNENRGWHPVCAKCGRSLTNDPIVKEVSWNAKYAGFGARFKAAFADGWIVYIVSRIPVAIINFTSDSPQEIFYDFGLHIFGFMFAIHFLYFVGFWAFCGQTPGKMLCDIAIIRTDGNQIGIKGAIVRYLAWGVSDITLGIGYLMILWDAQKQGLHDKIAGTYVVETTKQWQFMEDQTIYSLLKSENELSTCPKCGGLIRVGLELCPHCKQEIDSSMK